jgi:hypothetical protein
MAIPNLRNRAIVPCGDLQIKSQNPFFRGFISKKWGQKVPANQSLKRWKRDQNVKAALQNHIKQVAGVQKTVNPMNLRPALI